MRVRRSEGVVKRCGGEWWMVGWIMSSEVQCCSVGSGCGQWLWCCPAAVDAMLVVSRASSAR